MEPFDGFIDDHLNSFAGVIGAVIEPCGAYIGKSKTIPDLVGIWLSVVQSKERGDAKELLTRH